jgi:predicted PhzF superfamily epimerase YddE/YHI9
MTELHVVRVFLGPAGGGGNPLGVFLDGRATPQPDRQAVAADLAFSETVWVDAVEGGRATIRIFTPGVEMGFAGHPTIGTSWLLRETGRPVEVLAVPAGDVATWQDTGWTWIRARAAWANGIIEPQQFSTPAEVDALQPGRMGDPGLYAWAWEDEATGLGGVAMGDLLGRPLTIRQGVGSEIRVVPDPANGVVDVGGRVEAIDVRDYDVAAGAARARR